MAALYLAAAPLDLPVAALDLAAAPNHSEKMNTVIINLGFVITYFVVLLFGSQSLITLYFWLVSCLLSPCVSDWFSVCYHLVFLIGSLSVIVLGWGCKILHINSCIVSIVFTEVLHESRYIGHDFDA